MNWLEKSSSPRCFWIQGGARDTGEFTSLMESMRKILAVMILPGSRSSMGVELLLKSKFLSYRATVTHCLRL